MDYYGNLHKCANISWDVYTPILHLKYLHSPVWSISIMIDNNTCGVPLVFFHGKTMVEISVVYKTLW